MDHAEHPVQLTERAVVACILRLDWEHDEYRWIDPSDLARWDVVP